MKRFLTFLLILLLCVGCETKEESTFSIQPLTSDEQLKELANDDVIILSMDYLSENINDLSERLYDHTFYVADVSLKDLKKLDHLNIPNGVLPSETESFDLVGCDWNETGIVVNHFLMIEDCSEEYVLNHLKRIVEPKVWISRMKEDQLLSITTETFHASTDTQGDILRYLEVEIHTDMQVENGIIRFDNRNKEKEAYGQLRIAAGNMEESQTLIRRHQEDEGTVSEIEYQISFPISIEYCLEAIKAYEETGTIPDDDPSLVKATLTYHEEPDELESVYVSVEARKGTALMQVTVSFEGFGDFDEWSGMITLFSNENEW